jgi:DNA-directed RNA polymerase alpha subunit/DNA-directed RNA polymerase subunit L
MNPHVELNDIPENGDMLSFTLSGVNVSIANAIRRTIISDINTVVFRTTPNEKNKANIIANTSRLNNEVIKQRLSCIPIHIKDYDEFPFKNYIMEVNIENNTDTIMFVTTQNFKIRDLVSGKYLDETKTREIFPANDYTGCFIDFIRLRPKISEEIPGEKIHLTCEFDIGNAKEDGMFNVVSTCSYGFSIDDVVQEAELQRKRQTWKDESKSKEEIEFESKNWKLLDGMRITKKDSYDFIIDTVGVFTNSELIETSCKILINSFDGLNNLIEKDDLKIIKSQNTMANCFDVILENEDYTIGKVLEYFLYTKYYETNMLTFCGFKKMHPHDTYSIIRVAYSEAVEISTIKGHLQECNTESINIFKRIRKEFLKLVKN